MKEILQEVMMIKCWYILATVIIAITAGCAPKPQSESPTPSPEVKMPAMPEHAMNNEAKMAQGANDPKALYDVKCQKCHKTSEVFEKTDDCATCHKQGASLEGKVADVKWAVLVKEMQVKKADWISNSEATTIANWLTSEHSPEHK